MKRALGLVALDTASEDYQLKIARPALTEVRVGGTTAKDRDRFWGSVLLQLTPGVDVPLPSVAPDMPDLPPSRSTPSAHAPCCSAV